MKNRISLVELDALFATLQHRAFRWGTVIASCKKNRAVFLTTAGLFCQKNMPVFLTSGLA